MSDIPERDMVIKQTAKNMVDAGVLKPEEAEVFTDYLQQLDPKDLITALVESSICREKAPTATTLCVTVTYHVDVAALGTN